MISLIQINRNPKRKIDLHIKYCELNKNITNKEKLEGQLNKKVKIKKCIILVKKNINFLRSINFLDNTYSKKRFKIVSYRASLKCLSVFCIIWVSIYLLTKLQKCLIKTLLFICIDITYYLWKVNN